MRTLRVLGVAFIVITVSVGSIAVLSLRPTGHITIRQMVTQPTAPSPTYPLMHSDDGRTALQASEQCNVDPTNCRTTIIIPRPDETLRQVIQRAAPLNIQDYFNHPPTIVLADGRQIHPDLDVQLPAGVTVNFG